MTNAPTAPRSNPQGGLTLAIAGAAFGLLVGFVAGGVGPRREMATVEAENSRLKDELVKAQRSAAKKAGFGGGLLPGVEGIFGGAKAAPAEPTPAPQATPRAPEDRPVEAEAATQATPGPGPDPASPPTSDELVQTFDQAAELQAARAAQTRAAIIEQAELDPDEQREMDGIVQALEERIAEQADALAQLALSGEAPPTAEALRLSHEVTGALYDAQSGMEALIGPDRIDDLDEQALPVWNLMELDGLRDAVIRATTATP